MIVVTFKTCIVCGEDVASFPEEELAMCASHSDEDKLKALFRLRRAIEAKLKEISNV